MLGTELKYSLSSRGVEAVRLTSVLGRPSTPLEATWATIISSPCNGETEADLLLVNTGLLALVRLLANRFLGSPLHLLNVFQIVLKREERGIKLLHRPRSAETVRQST